MPSLICQEWLCSSPPHTHTHTPTHTHTHIHTHTRTHLFNWYQLYIFSVVKLKNSHLLSAGKSTLVLMYINFIFLSLGPLFFTYVYFVNFRCPQNDRTRCVTSQKGNAVLRMSLPTTSTSCATYPGRKRTETRKYCPNVCDKNQQFRLSHSLV